MSMAARVGDMHVCPMVTGTVPHVGGPVMPPGSPTVIIAGMPAAKVGDMCICVGPPDTIAAGSATVFIGGAPAARMGDSHCTWRNNCSWLPDSKYWVKKMITMSDEFTSNDFLGVGWSFPPTFNKQTGSVGNDRKRE
jgi:uncharacterized Zn-binding protein involved in type VI secretion